VRIILPAAQLMCSFMKYQSTDEDIWAQLASTCKSGNANIS